MKYFKREEFVCRCCGGLPKEAERNVEALVEVVLDPVRETFGEPIVVNSGYRCPRHNAAVGGVRNSQHLVGEAADIRPVGLPLTADGSQGLARLKELIIANGRFDQMIVYPTFVHVSWKRVGKNRKQIIYKHF